VPTIATKARGQTKGAALALVVALAACGGGDRAGDVVAETAENLRDVESAVLSVRLRIAPKAEEAQPVEVRLHGRFVFDGAGGLPVGRLRYTEVRGSRRETATLLATAHGAYVEVGGRAYELSPEQAARVARVRRLLAEGDWRGHLGLDDWIDDPSLSEGVVVDGTKTERIDGTLDIAAVSEDLAGLERIFGGRTTGPLADVDPDLIEAATRSAAVRLFTGEDDRLLRRLEVEIDLGFEVPSRLRRTLGRFEGARIYVELKLSDVNRPVTVAEPRSVRPSSGLPTR
jgi:hypothetical protein